MPCLKIRFCNGAGAFCSKCKVGPFFRKRFIDKDNAYLLEKSLNKDVGYRVFCNISQSPNNLFRKIHHFCMPRERFSTFGVDLFQEICDLLQVPTNFKENHNLCIETYFTQTFTKQILHSHENAEMNVTEIYAIDFG